MFYINNKPSNVMSHTHWHETECQCVTSHYWVCYWCKNIPYNIFHSRLRSDLLAFNFTFYRLWLTSQWHITKLQ